MKYPILVFFKLFVSQTFSSISSGWSRGLLFLSCSFKIFKELIFFLTFFFYMERLLLFRTFQCVCPSPGVCVLPFQFCQSCWELFWSKGALVPQVLGYCRARSIFPSASCAAEPFYQLGFLSLCQYSFSRFKENFIQDSPVFSSLNQTLVCRHLMVHFCLLTELCKFVMRLKR